MRRILTLSGLAGLAVLLAGACIGGIHSAVSASTIPTAPTAKLAFTQSGQAELPRGYRSWVHAYVAWEPIATSLLDLKPTPTPEFHNVYVEPYAYRTFMETGKWPEGSLIVKEFSFTSVDEKNCDGPPAYVCNVWFGKVIDQHGFTGVALMLKDSKRYPKDAGGWAYFSFGHQQPPYEKVSEKHPTERCAQCHIDRAGEKKDYVFSVNHPGLSREGDDAKHNLEAAFPN